MIIEKGVALLEVRNVTKSFGRVRAIDNVTISVAPGEFVALLGANGAGKTTLLQMLSGLFAPDAGEVVVMGHNLRRNAVRALREIGVVFQQPTLDLELSVKANLLFHADLQGLPRSLARRRIDAALAKFGLTDRAKDQARTLSGGNRRRVELARSMLHEPHVLLMDEATVGLDPMSRKGIIDDVLQLRSESNIGVLWATHLVDEVEYADRIIVLRKGRVLNDDFREALFERIAGGRPDRHAGALLALIGSGETTSSLPEEPQSTPLSGS